MSKELENALNELGADMRREVEEKMKEETVKMSDHILNNKKVSILGTEYTIYVRKEEEDSKLRTIDGYCDKTVKKIVICDVEREEDSCEDLNTYMKHLLRHELVHAYLYESGLGENMEHKPYGHEETMIDWLAVQFPKMAKTFQELGCLQEVLNE